MNRRLITLLLVIGTLIQTILSPWGAFGSLELPILTGLIICIALHADRAQMLYAAVLAGFLHDSFCPAPLGLSIPYFIGLAAGINWLRDEIFGDQPATYAVLGAAAAIFETVYYALVFSLSGLRPVSIGWLALRLAGGLITGIVVVPIIALSVVQMRSLTSRNRRRFV
jgi:rod shape-determining protein MreD